VVELNPASFVARYSGLLSIELKHDSRQVVKDIFLMGGI